MNILTNPSKLRGFEKHVKVENLSRRSILKGLGIAGSFVSTSDPCHACKTRSG